MNRFVESSSDGAAPGERPECHFTKLQSDAFKESVDLIRNALPIATYDRLPRRSKSCHRIESTVLEDHRTGFGRRSWKTIVRGSDSGRIVFWQGEAEDGSVAADEHAIADDHGSGPARELQGWSGASGEIQLPDRQLIESIRCRTDNV